MPEPAAPARPLAVLLGLFVLWELAFLPAANLIDFVPLRPGPADDGAFRDPIQERGTFTDCEPLQRSAEAVGRALDFWGEVTGQEQGWPLFSHGAPPHSMFCALQLRFPDGSAAEIRSTFEPADPPDRRPRAPMVHDRLFNHEVMMGGPAWFCSEESLALYPEVWSGGLPKVVADMNPYFLAWMRWKVRNYAAARPGCPDPEEVVMLVRYIPIPPPGSPPGWRGPVVVRPFARWRPGDAADGFLPVECYDPVKKVFVRLPVGGES